jgi:hypothetical protein
MPSAPIEIVLRSARLSVVSGQVLGAAGGPVRGGTLELAHLDGLHGYDTRTIDIRPDGTFEIPALQPGGFFLQHFEAGLPTGRPSDWKVSRATVRVADRDVVDVRVLPVSMVRVSGRVVIAPSEQPLLDPSRVRVEARPVNADDNPGPQVVGDAKPDWTFQFFTWPGIGRVQVTIRTSASAPLWTTVVRLNGQDVTGKEITFTPGQDLSGLEVELTRRR